MLLMFNHNVITKPLILKPGLQVSQMVSSHAKLVTCHPKPHSTARPLDTSSEHTKVTKALYIDDHYHYHCHACFQKVHS